MTAADGTIGRRLPAIVATSPVAIDQVHAAVVVSRDWQPGQLGYEFAHHVAAVLGRAGSLPSGEPLGNGVLGGWLAGLELLAAHGDFVWSITPWCAGGPKTNRDPNRSPVAKAATVSSHGQMRTVGVVPGAAAGQATSETLTGSPPSFGRMTAALVGIFRAAIRSAGAASPQAWQRNRPRVSRLALAQWPHRGQVRLVLRGSTTTTRTPACRALYSTNVRSWAKLQLWWRARCRRPTVTRSRMPLRSSRAIPRPVPVALRTTVLLMQWLTSRW
jgi:hypothetical protein